MLLAQRYAVHDEIAAGGMAAVHVGRLLGPAGFSRTVAIKRLHAHVAKQPDFVTMFLDEARLAARIRHPNVVPTLEVVTEDAEVFLILEYVHGESLGGLARAAERVGERMPPAIAVAIMSGALHGLHAAHEASGADGAPLGIVHRDVSPQNVLVGVDGVARVLDFGVAKAAGRLQVTRDGQIKGKFSYMAPEQILAEPLDRRADVFAAAVVTWEALTGRRLFQAEDPGAVVHQVLTQHIPPAGELVTSLPLALDSVLARAMSRTRDERFPTARDMAVALERALAPAPAREVGEWVERVAGEALARRARRLAAIEAAEAAGADVGPASQPLHGPPSVPAPALGPTSSATSPGVGGVSAVWSGRSPSGRDVEPRSQISTVSVSSAITAVRPRAARRRLAVGLAVAGAAVSALALAAWLRFGAARDDAPSIQAAATTEAPRASPAQSAEIVVAPEPTSEVAPPPDEPPPASAASETARRPAAPPRAPRPAPPAPAAPAKAKDPPAAASPAPAAAPPPPSPCDIPFTVDDKGIKRPKPGCFKPK